MKKIFLLTLRPEFFQDSAFGGIPGGLPAHIWGECQIASNIPTATKSPCSWNWGLSLGTTAGQAGDILPLFHSWRSLRLCEI